MEPRTKHITARTDQETRDWYEQIAKNEHRSLSHVIHLALKKLMANYRPDEITKETKT